MKLAASAAAASGAQRECPVVGGKPAVPFAVGLAGGEKRSRARAGLREDGGDDVGKPQKLRRSSKAAQEERREKREKKRTSK